MTRDELVAEVQKRVPTKNLFKHILAVEAVMGRLAQELEQDQERWGAAGLLHDIDYEETKADPNAHSLLSGKIAREFGYDQEIVHAVEAHNHVHGIPRDSLMDKALYSADPLTGLIVAAALVSPTKKLKDIDAGFVEKRMGEKSFARGADRDTIKACSELGLDIHRFIELGLEGMQGISDELGL